MAADYHYNYALVATMLDRAHSTDASMLRQNMLAGEYDCLIPLVTGKNILIAWSWLWHDSFALAPYAKYITGIEILQPFVDIANKRMHERHIDNIYFIQGDFFTARTEIAYDVVVLNMGTIGNFDDKKTAINTLLKLWKVLTVWFREPNINHVTARVDMYKAEWGLFAVEWTTIREVESWLESTCTSKQEIDNIVADAGARVTYNHITLSYYVAIIQQ